LHIIFKCNAENLLECVLITNLDIFCSWQLQSFSIVIYEELSLWSAFNTELNMKWWKLYLKLNLTHINKQISYKIIITEIADDYW